ncbi:hypothetical protein [Micromonospora sp. NPDC004704]
MSDSTDTTDRLILPYPRYCPDRHGGFAAVDFGTTNSTVTLYDPSRPRPSLPLPVDQRAALRRETADLLRREPRAEELTEPRQAQCRAEWSVLRTRIAADLAQVDPQALADLVAVDESTNGPLLYDVLLALDNAQIGCTPQLGAWLAARLHHCYDTAFSTPALAHHSLYPVRLDSATELDEVSSRLDVTDVDPYLRVRLGIPLAHGASYGTVLGLKHHLNDPDYALPLRDDPRRVGFDALLGAAVGFLLQETDRFTGANPDRLDGAPVDHVVATYPTMAPPSARRRLDEVIGSVLGVGDVDLSYDEAISAALFFLMRDLGTDYELGIEALRARFRPVPGEERHWTENMLVIDIGGGTTDIALVTVHLHDGTPELPDVEPGTAGRYYRVVPQLRGTSGRNRRGGDFLTLQVFHWLKAVIADHLLTIAWPEQTGFGESRESWRQWQDGVTANLERSYQDDNGRYVPGSLVERTLEALRRDTDVPDSDAAQRVRDNVERVVGTRFDPHRIGPGSNQVREQTFWAIWRRAEEAKKQIAPGTPYRLATDHVQDIVRTLDSVPTDQPTEIGQGPVELGYGSFAGAATPMLVEISKLAAGLAASRLDATERLDRIILTGKASQLALAAEVVAREFAARRPRGEPAVEVVVERTYPKNAASIGAAWAASISSLGAPDADTELLRQGVTEVAVEVDNLLLELPCALAVRSRADRNRVVLPAGTPFEEFADGRLRAFAQLGVLGDRCVIERQVDGGHPLPWGSFQWRDLDARIRAEDPGLSLDRKLWPARISAGIEVDGSLSLELLLWQGSRPYLRIDESQAAVQVPVGPSGAPAEVLRLADRILVEPPDGQPPRPAFGSGTGNRAFTRETFVDELGESRPGVLGHLPLPPPDDSGGWTFLLRADDGGERPIGTLDAAFDTEATYVVSLDARGAVRVHAGAPPLWTTSTVLDIEHERGLVFRLPLGTPQSDFDDHDSPFDGTH